MDKVKKVWYYFYAQFGPGHQSTYDGFLYLEDTLKTEDIEARIAKEIKTEIGYDVAMDYDYWRVDRPSEEYKTRMLELFALRISAISDLLNSLLKDNISLLQDEIKPTRGSPDPEIAKAFSRCIMPSLLNELHKLGIIVTENTVEKWRRGDITPASSLIPTILKAAKKAKKYNLKVL